MLKIEAPKAAARGDADTDEDPVRTLFRKWIATGDEYDADWDDKAGAGGRLLALERQILTTPSSSPVALAIKLYLTVHDHDDGWRDREAGLSKLPCNPGFVQALRDCAAIVPEIDDLLGDLLRPRRSRRRRPAIAPTPAAPAEVTGP